MKKKIKLRRETIRSLTLQERSVINGGAMCKLSGSCSDSCNTQQPDCFDPPK
jgi:hypothetical protein